MLLYNPVVLRTKRWIDNILAEPLSLIARTVVDAVGGSLQLRKERLRSGIALSIPKIDKHRLVRSATVDREAYGDVLDKVTSQHIVDRLRHTKLVVVRGHAWKKDRKHDCYTFSSQNTEHQF